MQNYGQNWTHGPEADLRSVDSGVCDDQRQRNSWRRIHQTSVRRGHQSPDWKRELHKALNKIEKGPLDRRRFVDYHKNGLNYDLHHISKQRCWPDAAQRRWNPSKNHANEQACRGVLGDLPYFTEIAHDWTNNLTVWSSKMLCLNLGLDIPIKLPSGVKTIMFIAAPENPPGLFLFTVFDETPDGTSTDRNIFYEYTVIMARHLRETLAKVIRDEIPYIVPWAFQHLQFSKEAIQKAVEETWNDDLSSGGPRNARQYWDKGPTELSPKQCVDVKEGMFLLHSLSKFPSCMQLARGGERSAKTAYIMEPDLTDAVLNIIEGLLNSGRPCEDKITCDLHNPRVQCAVVEAARRLAFQMQVSIITKDYFIIDIVTALEREQNGSLQLTVDKKMNTQTRCLIFQDFRDESKLMVAIPP